MSAQDNPGLTHLDGQGRAHMVDVGGKETTRRYARAGAVVYMQPETLSLIMDNGLPKGDVLACARIAGIMAAKRAHELIPLCHPLPLDSISVELHPEGANELHIASEARCTHRTGAEMEALTACSVAALTVYDMCKAADRAMEIGRIRLLEKDGGKSGRFIRED